MIQSGEVDVGRVICPVSTQLHRGTEMVERKAYGRLISLKNIRLKHLQLMEERGLLRQTNSETLTTDECKDMLNKRNGKLPFFNLNVASFTEQPCTFFISTSASQFIKSCFSIFTVVYSDSASPEELQKLIRSTETQRSFVIWHDHSDIAGRSTYVICIWFMYDPAVYLTEQELG